MANPHGGGVVGESAEADGYFFSHEDHGEVLVVGYVEYEMSSGETESCCPVGFECWFACWLVGFSECVFVKQRREECGGLGCLVYITKPKMMMKYEYESYLKSQQVPQANR